MKVIRLLAVCSVVMSLAVGVSFAHPPSGVTVKYDAASAVLTVEAMHKVQDEGDHFIEEIKVLKNGKQMILQNFSRQTDRQKLSAAYTVPGLKKGDEITVTADCNYGGYKTGVLKIQ